MLKFKKHGLLKPPTDEEISRMTAEELKQIYEAYHSAIENATDDPLDYGIELAPWADADKCMESSSELWCFGGNRSSKTTYGARTAVSAALRNEDARILCFSQDAVSSVRVQQKAVYEWLPRDLKEGTRSATGYIKYSLKNGFTGDSLIIPHTNSIIAFHTYSQFLNNPGKFEGLEVGSMEPTYINLGIWLDEYLQGPDLVNTLRFRLATRDAKLLGTFTPIDGVTEFVDGIIKGADTIQDRNIDRFPDLAVKRVPYIQHSLKREAKIIYFHSDQNPFGGYPRLERDLKGASENEILTRFYGIPTKMLAGQFPMFRRSVNVMRHSDMMNTIRDCKCTLYQGIDPGAAKRWFAIWVAVDEDDNWYVYREWPDKSYGDWATMGKNNKSRLSDAAKVDGQGVRDYVKLFKDEENGEVIYERLIDPRAGASPKQEAEGTTTLINQLEDEGCVVLPAPGATEDAGIALLNGLMSYNDDNPVDAANKPRFYISDKCENTIDSLLNYTASEGPAEAWKDPIDVLRYLAVSEITWEGNLITTHTRKTNGGY